MLGANRYEFFILPCGLAFALIYCHPSFATRTSYHNAHPTGWMYGSPVGETPGWASETWFDLEGNHANVWNQDFSMTDRRTGDVYRYKADFEQSSGVANLGHALNTWVALGIEVPYANRNGGIMDDFIDQFHQTINTSRFLRHLNEEFGNSFIIQKNDVDQLATKKAQGVGNVKAQVKFWLLQWRSPTPGVCDCGLAVSAQGKFPTQRRELGLTSGSEDYSGLIHLGVPLWKYVGVWASAGFTKLGPNKTFDGWPRRDWQQMYELSIDLGFSANLGIIAQGRLESPLFMKEYLSFNHQYSEADNQSIERVASGWNSLVRWRGTETIGLRYRWGRGSSISFLLLEDWCLGDADGRGDWNYVTNAPDVALVSQLHFLF